MSGSFDHSGPAIKLEDTFTLLDSRDLLVVEGIRRLILEHLSSGKEPWLVNALVDHYYATGSLTAKDILAEIREPLDKVLVDKIQEGLRSQDTKILATQLLLYIVDRQPPWAHNLVERPIFTALLKYLKSEVDIPMLMSGLMVLVILLPVVPVSIASHLHDVFEIFARVAGLMVKKPANAPEVFMLHLHIAVYVLFLRLYGMFPCTFLNFMRAHFTKKENLMVYNDIIHPMLEKVRFNPLLVGGSNDPETAKSRWKKMEPHDIVVNCAKMSLDLIEGTAEELRCPVIPQPPPEIITIMKPPSRSQKPPDASWQEKMEKVSELFPVVIDPASYGFSPSQMLGLSTPPTSQRATPAASFMDLTTSHQQSTAGTVSASPQLATPIPEPTVREMPVMADEGDRLTPSNKTTPVPTRTGPKNTPVQLGRAHCSSAFSSPLYFHPAASSSSQPPSVGPSPMKPLASSESAALGQDSGTARMLTFLDRSHDDKSNHVPKHIGALLGKDHVGSGAAGPVPVDSLPSIIRNLMAQDSDPLDQEVSLITEAEEELSPSGFPVHCAAPGTSTEKSDTPESVKRFMKKVNRIRFNSLTSHLSEPAMVAGERSPYTGRARSCPPLRRKPLVSDAHPAASPGSCWSGGNGSKLDTVSESAVVIQGKIDDACGVEGSFFTSQDLRRRPYGSKDGSEASSSVQTKTCVCQSVGGSLHYIQDLAHIFRSLLVPINLAVCRQCQQILISNGWDAGEVEERLQQQCPARSEGSWTTWPVATRCLYSALSPPELLDRHLFQGKELHAKELSHIPLTSNETVSWTHFGGGPPADEINILRGQKLMLQNQVMYERHKRFNHAMRNRRLLRRIAHVSALEELVQALTHQLAMQGKDIQNLQVSLKLLQDHNHQLLQTKDSDEYEKLVDFKTTIQQNKDIQEANTELKNLLLSQKAENDELRKELQVVRAKCFELEKDNELLHTEMTSVSKWKAQVVQLQKELLLMGEAHERLHSQIQQQQRLGQESCQASSEMIILSLKAEIKELRKGKTQTILAMEAARLRLGESEESSKTKDLATKDIKQSFEAAKSMYSDEIKAVEDKYQAMVRLNQQMESQILSLQADNDCMHQKIASLQLQLSRYQGDPSRTESPHSSRSSHSMSSKEGSAADNTEKGNEGEEQKEGDNKKGGSKERRKGKRPDQKAHADTTKHEILRDGKKELPVDSNTEVLSDGCCDPRKVSQSKDSGRGSLTASEHALKCVQFSESGGSGKSKPASEASTLNKLKSFSRASKKNVSKSSKVVHSQNVTTSVAPGSAHVLGKTEAVKRDESGDVVSEASDAVQGLEESRTMLYTDSEDGSQSSNSIFTADSGIDSKATG